MAGRLIQILTDIVNVDGKYLTISSRRTYPHEGSWIFPLLNSGGHQVISDVLNNVNSEEKETTYHLLRPFYGATLKNREELDKLCKIINDSQVDYTDRQVKEEYKVVEVSFAIREGGLGL